MIPGALLRARLHAASGRPEAVLMLAERLAEHGAGLEAVRQIGIAARDGYPEAQTRFGLCYLRGQGVPVNIGEARHWLETAADAGDVSAQTEVASLALRGISGPYRRSVFAGPTVDGDSDPDHRLAADLARRAADSGSAEGQALLAYILHLSPSLAKNPEEADALYRASSDAGWPLGQLGHAMTLMRDGTPDMMRKGHDLLLAAAEANLPTAEFLLGAMAEAGSGTEQNPEDAAAHYRRGADLGHIGAKTRLGLALLTGRGTTRNLVEAETWLRRAGLDGDVMAAAVLGDFHASPDRSPPNLEEAARWYRRAAELGHPGSAHVLARTISAGAEGLPDLAEIVAWLETAIERGEASAWPDLGRLIATMSLPPDRLPALHGWLQRMIQEQHPEAGFYVGLCVNGGIGTPTDEKLARRYYLWAAGEGVIEAMVAAAEMLFNGRGGSAEPGVARSLLEYAGNRGHAGALYALGVLAGNDRDRAMQYFRRAADRGHAKARRQTESTAATAPA